VIRSRAGVLLFIAWTACERSPDVVRRPTAAPSPARSPDATGTAADRIAPRAYAKPSLFVVPHASIARVPGTRDELEKFASRSGGDPDLMASALLSLALLDVEADEAAWDTTDPAWTRDPETAADFARARAIATLRRVVADFPQYARRDDALYLLGYCLQREGDSSGARTAFEGIFAERPASRLIAEAWFRIGETHFETGAYSDAVHAFQKSLARRDSRFAAAALYKIAWSHYLGDRFAEAAAAFERLLAAPPDAEFAAALRPEVIQYLALSLVEQDWDGDGAPAPSPSGDPATTAPVARVAAFVRRGGIWREVAQAAGQALAAEGREGEARAVRDLLAR